MAPAFSDSDTRSASLPLVSVRALTVSYSMRGGQQSPARTFTDVNALTDVDFDVPHGAALGIFGESGCGKSTLLLSLANLLRFETITRGAVFFKGRNLLAESERALQRVRGAQIGVVVQEAGTALNPVRRVGPQIVEVFSAHTKSSRRESREAAYAALEGVGLSPKRTFDSWPHQLSGGQRQRVLIAQALVCGPALLLADEPTHGLDSSASKEITHLLDRKTTACGMALVISSHRPDVLKSLTTHLLVFYAGELIESGRTDEVLAHPLHPYTRALVNCFQLESRPAGGTPVRLKTIPGAPPQTNGRSRGCHFANRCIHHRTECFENHPALLSLTSTSPGSLPDSETLAREALPLPLPRKVRCVLYEN